MEFKWVAGAILAYWISIRNPECCCLNSNTLLHTYIYIYIYIVCMDDVILTISPTFIFLLFVKHVFINPILLVSGITFLEVLLFNNCFHYFIKLVDNSADISCFELVSDIKVSYCNVNRSYLWFKEILCQHDKCHCVINSYKLSLSWILFLC